MNMHDELGQRATEVVAQGVYDRFGDKIPVDVDPQMVADKAYEIYLRKRARQEMKVSCRAILATCPHHIWTCIHIYI